MKAVSEAYERIKQIEMDILDIQKAAEKILDKQMRVWLSFDFEDDLVQQMTYTTTTSSGAFMIIDPSQQPQQDNGFTIDIPDTVALEVLGILVRHKQQLIDDESNNL